MNREKMLHQLNETSEWDILIIGGGATGLGAALDASSRGYKTLLLEQFDFSKGTSSRSTKLVHGGVRYLEQGNIKLVREALRERGYLLQNASHLTSVQTFIIPVFKWWQKFYYAIGLKLYDLLAGKLSLGKTKVLSKKQTILELPAINSISLKGGILYFDGQFDDSRLSIELAISAVMHSATVINYCKVTEFIKKDGKIKGVKLMDTLCHKPYSISAKAVINATGVFTDAVLQMDDAEQHNMVSPSQGIHLVVDTEFFPGKNGMMIPKTDDGRVLFAVPWHSKVVLGTTDTPVDSILSEPLPLEEEIDFILQHFNRFCKTSIQRENVKSVYVGLRPLVNAKNNKQTSLLSRDHTLVVSASGLVTITGGKWTTYRKMAEDAVENAVFISKQEKRNCKTKHLQIGEPVERRRKIESMSEEDSSLQNKIHPNFPYTLAELMFAIRYEMAVTIEDILARRTRLLFLDAKAAIESSALVASMMASELGKDEIWMAEQCKSFKKLANQYLLT